MIRTKPSSSIRTLASLRIAVDHPVRVRGGQSVAELPPDVQHLFLRNSSEPAEERGEIFAPDELHRVEELAGIFSDVEHAADRRVRDLPRKPDLADDAFAGLGPGRPNQLDRDGRVEHEIVGPPDVAAAADAQAGHHAIPAGQHVAGCEAAGWRRCGRASGRRQCASRCAFPPLVHGVHCGVFLPVSRYPSEMTRPPRPIMSAMLCAAAVTAQYVAAKATRDALFLTSVGFDALPAMLIATSVCSILLVAVHARLAPSVKPGRLVPLLFASSGVIFFCEWLVRAAAPQATAVIVYMQISGAGPLLTSGFWLIASERFDPLTAKRGFGQIAAAGTVGGLLGALLAERVGAILGAPAMLLFLAAIQIATGWLLSLMAAQEPQPASQPSQPSARLSPPRSDLRVIAQAPHLRQLVILVLFGTTSAALLEYLFKARAVETLGPGDHLLRFFALYYATTSLISFVLQVVSSGAVLERFGLALSTSAPSIALLAGSLGSLVVPGFASITVARAVESVFRGSWFRAGYELFYTPIPEAEKRAAKGVIDVAVDRLGDAVGGGLVRLAVVMAPAAQASIILYMGMVCSAIAILAASRLNGWYLRTLGSSLLRQAPGLGRVASELDASRTVVPAFRTRHQSSVRSAAAWRAAGSSPVDQELAAAAALRSGSVERAKEVLARSDRLSPGLVSYVIALLGVDPAAEQAMAALRKVADLRVGQLTDALLDPAQDHAVRRRLARVLSASTSQRAADGLQLALDDVRFDVRVQAARSLAAIAQRDPGIRLDGAHLHEVVLREVAVGRPVWEGRRLLDGFLSSSPLDEFVRDRAGQSLAHVFTLLSLTLPREPLLTAFRSLQSEDARLRGTALEYLEGVLPASNPTAALALPGTGARRTRPPAILLAPWPAGDRRAAAVESIPHPARGC